MQILHFAWRNEIIKIMKYTRVFLALIVVVMLAALGAYAYQVYTGRGEIFRNKVWVVLSQAKVFFTASQIRGKQDEPFKNIIFVHRSIGAGILDRGKMRQMLQQQGYQVWDQGYRVDGLRDPSGSPTGISYFIPRDNTDPDGLYELFMQTPSDYPVNGLSELFLHDVIMFKSCFTASDLPDDAKLEQSKQYYLAVRDVMDRHPEKLFILLTQPPRNPAETDLAAARRARELAEWLHSDEFTQGHANIRVFDLFDLLAEPDQSAADANTLKKAYRVGSDSHPNESASVLAAQELAEFVVRATEDYRSVSSRSNDTSVK
jgi:hypothetical protein